MMNCSWKYSCALCAALALAAPVPADELDPANVHAVIVGVLKYKHHRTLESFPNKNRKDRELRDLLVRRGTPAKNIALLTDKDATLANIRAAVQTAARNAEKNSTLLIYYNGHGFPDDDGQVVFANYEAKKTGWSLQDLGATLADEFHGQRVLLCADACYSGALSEVVMRLAKRGIPAAALSLCGTDCESTGTWTFTQSIIDGLNGDAMLDLNGDGRITLQELVADVAESMRHRESQFHGYKANGVADDFVIAKASGSRPKAEDAKYAIGSYVKVRGRKMDKIGRVVAFKDNQYTLEFVDFSDKYTESFTADELTVSKNAPDCEVEWEGQWYPAKLIKTDKEKYYVHYLGFKKSWDEWVGKDRMRNLIR